MTDHPYTATARSQLARLATLTDVVYAVGLVLIVSWLPLPEESHATGAIWFAYVPIAAVLRKRGERRQDALS